MKKCEVCSKRTFSAIDAYDGAKNRFFCSIRCFKIVFHIPYAQIEHRIKETEVIQYVGNPTTGEVLINNDRNWEKLDPRTDLRNHSPTGFGWGYGGSGPAQLALAILAHHLQDDEKALSLYQKFKFRVIARLHQNQRFVLNQDTISGHIDALEGGTDFIPKWQEELLGLE